MRRRNLGDEDRDEARASHDRGPRPSFSMTNGPERLAVVEIVAPKEDLAGRRVQADGVHLDGRAENLASAVVRQSGTTTGQIFTYAEGWRVHGDAVGIERSVLGFTAAPGCKIVATAVGSKSRPVVSRSFSIGCDEGVVRVHAEMAPDALMPRRWQVLRLEAVAGEAGPSVVLRVGRGHGRTEQAQRRGAVDYGDLPRRNPGDEDRDEARSSAGPRPWFLSHPATGYAARLTLQLAESDDEDDCPSSLEEVRDMADALEAAPVAVNRAVLHELYGDGPQEKFTQRQKAKAGDVAMRATRQLELWARRYLDLAYEGQGEGLFGFDVAAKAAKQQREVEEASAVVSVAVRVRDRIGRDEWVFPERGLPRKNPGDEDRDEARASAVPAAGGLLLSFTRGGRLGEECRAKRAACKPSCDALSRDNGWLRATNHASAESGRPVATLTPRGEIFLLGGNFDRVRVTAPGGMVEAADERGFVVARRAWFELEARRYRGDQLTEWHLTAPEASGRGEEAVYVATSDGTWIDESGNEVNHLAFSAARASSPAMNPGDEDRDEARASHAKSFEPLPPRTLAANDALDMWTKIFDSRAKRLGEASEDHRAHWFLAESVRCARDALAVLDGAPSFRCQWCGATITLSTAWALRLREADLAGAGKLCSCNTMPTANPGDEDRDEARASSSALLAIAVPRDWIVDSDQYGWPLDAYGHEMSADEYRHGVDFFRTDLGAEAGWAVLTSATGPPVPARTVRNTVTLEINLHDDEDDSVQDQLMWESNDILVSQIRDGMHVFLERHGTTRGQRREVVIMVVDRPPVSMTRTNPGDEDRDEARASSAAHDPRTVAAVEVIERHVTDGFDTQVELSRIVYDRWRYDLDLESAFKDVETLILCPVAMRRAWIDVRGPGVNVASIAERRRASILVQDALHVFSQRIHLLQQWTADPENGNRLRAVHSALDEISRRNEDDWWIWPENRSQIEADRARRSKRRVR